MSRNIDVTKEMIHLVESVKTGDELLDLVKFKDIELKGVDFYYKLNSEIVYEYHRFDKLTGRSTFTGNYLYMDNIYTKKK